MKCCAKVLSLAAAAALLMAGAGPWNASAAAASDGPGADGAATQPCASIGGKTRAGTVDGRQATVFSGSGDWVQWQVTVPQDGVYTLRFTYCPLPGKGLDLTGYAQVDGQPELSSAREFTLSRRYKDTVTAFAKDIIGNEITPEQEELSVWMTGDEREYGAYDDGWRYYTLKAGTHTVRVTDAGEPFALADVSFALKEQLPSYSQYQSSTAGRPDNASQMTVIEAEKCAYRSQAYILPASDRSSPLTTPYDPNRIRLNVIGGTDWEYSGQSVTWSADVAADGYYQIAFRYKQDAVRGFFTTRSLSIDGKTLFSGMDDIRFPYSSNFSLKVLGDGRPCAVYLTKGTHTFTLEAAVGDMSGYFNDINSAVVALNSIYQRIVMITGVSPDIYRDYSLETVIPELQPTFTSCSKQLRQIAAAIESVSTQGSEAETLSTMANELDSLSKNPETIPERLDNFETDITSLQAWLLSVAVQPLTLDKIYVSPVNSKLPKAKAGFFQTLADQVHSFIGSFFIDYSQVGSTTQSSRSISVWVSSGRDQAAVIRRLADQKFTSKTGVSVKISLVQGALVQAVLAGNGPDIALDVGRGDPVNLGMRGAAADLSGMNGFEDVTKRFKSGAMVPYTLSGKCYALPETQLFHMMFYRADIFKLLGLKVPDTWQQLIEITPTIQAKNMEIGLPYVQMDAYAVVSAGMGSQSLFPTLLLQNGGSFYNAAQTKTALDTPQAFSAFKTWEEFYTQYGFTLVKDDFSRFRTGEMPLIIAGYTFYNQLAIGAPELKGLWKMTEVPGTARSDGTIDRTEGASGTACVMLSAARDKNACWEFLKWWTSADIQAGFGNDMEIIQGTAGRYNTANVEAFHRLKWTQEESAAIENQWDRVQEIPEVPGGYYTSRNIDNAFRAVLFNSENPRDALYYWNKDTNLEIQRKRAEFSVK